MKKFCFHAGAFLAGMTAMAALLASTAVGAEDTSIPPPAPANSTAGGGNVAGMEVMTRGPIHEAFAQPVSAGAVNQLVVPKDPPAAIDEIPPDEKPADENATWIGGYWAWDDGRKDFDWVSGVWRVPPPNQRWVAGYWTDVSGGHSWVPGFWTTTTAENVVYYPEPPASLEQGPTSEQPSSNDLWIPGCWRWVNARYAWQPGYWAAAQPDWIWTPASYCWSPRGWVFCNGFWDYRLNRRGLLFAPVSFTSPIFRRAGYTYCPSVVIDSGVLPFYLFVRPDCSQYYFGDYYAANYDRLGIYPWCAVGRHRGYGYDPLFTYYRWRNVGRDPDWAKNLRGWYAYYRAHPERRLPHTLTATQRALASAGNRTDRQFMRIADTLHDLRKNPRSDVRLTAVSSEQRIRYRQDAVVMRQFGKERRRIETNVAAATGRGKLVGPNAATRRKTPETLHFPAVARSFNDHTMGHIQGTVRQTMKPIVPPASPERRSATIQREARRPVIHTQPPMKHGGTQGTVHRDTPKSVQKPQRLPEKKMPKAGGKNLGPSTGPTPHTGRGGTESPRHRGEKKGSDLKKP